MKTVHGVYISMDSFGDSLNKVFYKKEDANQYAKKHGGYFYVKELILIGEKDNKKFLIPSDFVKSFVGDIE